ncbi:MAG: universal stress protein [Bacteroidota bacterium]
MKKTILVPIDFSPSAQNALHYALAWAVELEARLEVLHVYGGTFSLEEMPAFQLGQGREEALLQRLTEFSQIPAGVPGANLVLSRQLRLHPTVADAIVERSKEMAADYIVMGTKGSHDPFERWLGSVSSTVAQRARCPVFLIPKPSRFQGFKHLLYASNFESVSPPLIDQISAWAQRYQAKVHFIHVDDIPGRPAEEFATLEDELYQRLFKNGDPPFPLNLATVRASSVSKGLRQYASENDIDLLILVNRQRQFWDNVLGESLTKDMALGTTVPLLVLDYDTPQ